MDSQKAIAALKKLSDLYWLMHTPDTCREFIDDAGEQSKMEQELAMAGYRFCRKVDAARRELLATGFTVPNSWLMVQAFPVVKTECWRVGKPSKRRGKWRGRIEITHPERDRIEAITAEIYAERMRLEAGGGREEPAVPTRLTVPQVALKINMSTDRINERLLDAGVVRKKAGRSFSATAAEFKLAFADHPDLDNITALIDGLAK